MTRYKIYSANKSARHIAGMFYHALGYKGSIYKIDVSIAGVPKLIDDQVTIRTQITCNKEKPATKEIFINKALEGNNARLLNIIGALDENDTRRISVMVLPPHIDMSSITHNVADKETVAILNTPLISPTADEENEIMNFIDYLEAYRESD